MSYLKSQTAYINASPRLPRRGKERRDTRCSVPAARLPSNPLLVKDRCEGGAWSRTDARSKSSKQGEVPGRRVPFRPRARVRISAHLCAAPSVSVRPARGGRRIYCVLVTYCI